jgi:hypothetical protein
MIVGVQQLQVGFGLTRKQYAWVLEVLDMGAYNIHVKHPNSTLAAYLLAVRTTFHKVRDIPLINRVSDKDVSISLLPQTHHSPAPTTPFSSPSSFPYELRIKAPSRESPSVTITFSTFGQLPTNFTVALLTPN